MLHRSLLIIWLFLAVVTTIHAEWWGNSAPPDNDWEPPPEDQNSSNDGLDGVVSGLRRRREGRVLSADTVEEEGRPVHRIRILNEQGRVRPLHFDATGRPLPRFHERYPYRDRR